MLQVENRKFGWQFGASVGLLSLAGLWFSWWEPIVVSLLVVALAHLALAVVAPAALELPNRAWTTLGNLLGKLLSPIVLTLMFTGIFVPIAFLMRLAGRDHLLLRDRSGKSFWVVRPTTAIPVENFRRQY